MKNKLKCMDCPKLYSNFPLDVNLPRGQWLLINPKDRGVLCANCILKRASKLPNVTIAHLIFEISI